MERRPSDLPARVTYTLPTRKVTWKDENEYLNLEPTAPPLPNTNRRNSFDNKLDTDLTQVKVLKHKAKDLTKSQSSDIIKEIEVPFWCKGCVYSTPDRLVRGRWTLCTNCQRYAKWCKKCLEQDSHVLVKKGDPCSVCDTKGKDFPCLGCVDTHPEVSITFVERRYILCQICRSHGLNLCTKCEHSFSGKNCLRCTALSKDTVQVQSPEKSSQSSDCEQGVLLIKESEPEQVNGKEDKKCKKSYKCIVQ